MLDHLDTLLAMAREAHGEDITPCHNKIWSECLSEHRDHVMLWYNKPCGSTAIQKIKKEKSQ
jgi:hypothetical protein